MPPKTLILMRHAEKPDDPRDPDLTAAGMQRAKTIARWIPEQLGAPPDFIFAAAISKHSARPFETVKPLAKSTGVAIDGTVADQDYAVLAQELLSDARYENALIVVCWHHGNIPPFARKLAAPAGTYPDPWPEEVFNLVIRFDFVDGTTTVTQITEDF
jgi:phosphohistidine phosphatase SixA